jgi:hypothetical protein
MALPARIPRNLPARKKPVREGMSAKHLAFIRSLPCCVCGSVHLVHAHHLLRTGEHGMGQRSADKYALPLCDKWAPEIGCHRKLHVNGDEEAWLASVGIDGRSLAASLWRVSGDREAALTILWKARNHG